MSGNGCPNAKAGLLRLAAVTAALAAALSGALAGCTKQGKNMEQANAAPDPVVLLKTSMGDIKIELAARQAPITVKNFLQYVQERHYDGTIFHRVMPGFMIQGGGFEPGMKEKPTRASIRNESANGLTNVVGSLAMARTPDPHSASAQFFINVADNGFLNRAQAEDGWGYAVFGKVVEGMDVVNKIAAVRTHTVEGHQNVPVEPVMIVSARRIEQ